MDLINQIPRIGFVLFFFKPSLIMLCPSIAGFSNHYYVEMMSVGCTRECSVSDPGVI